MSEDKDSRSRRTDKTVAPEEERPKRTKAETEKSSARTRKSSRTKTEEAPPVSTPSEEVKTTSPKRTRTKKAEAETSTSVTEEAPARMKASVVAKSEERPKARKTAKKAAPEKEVPVTPKGEITRAMMIRSRLWRLRLALRRKQPAFRHDQAHRWLRVPQSWRKVRGNDNDARRRCKGKIQLVSPGYRKPVITRDLHPSGYIEVLVSRPTEMTGLNPQIHAVRIAGNVGAKKRQDIIKQAENLSLRVLNPGVSKRAKEEELFTGLEGLEETEVETK